MRINRYLAACGLASRRGAERYILSGEIEINGQPLSDLGYRVGSGDLVAFRGRPLHLPRQWSYFALNKPIGYVVSRAQFRQQRNIYELLPDHLQKLGYAGRLDRQSSGLLLLSNDGSFAQRVIDRGSHLPRHYRLSLDHLPAERNWRKMFLQGLEIDGQRMQAAGLTVADRRRGRVDITLLEGRNRQIRRMFAAFNCRVEKLHRYAIGRLNLDRLELAPGSFTLFQPEELFGPAGGGFQSGQGRPKSNRP